MPSKRDRAWNDYSEHFRKEGLPIIMSSAVTLTIYQGDGSDFDVKQATELGAIMLLDKPLIILGAPGAKLPSRLVKAADVIIEDWSPENHEAQDRLAEAVVRLKQENER